MDMGNRICKFKEVPIYIISFNRLTVLKKLIRRLEKDGYRNLHIIDNHSDNEDLLEYLNHSPHIVHRMEENMGHLVFWKSGLFDEVIQSSYYVITDPDILPDTECPDNYVEHFYRVLQEYPARTKVGFALKIDDIPYTYQYRMDIVRWESFFYDNILSYSPLLFDVGLDTTFALYRPGRIDPDQKDVFQNGIRTGYPYVARHMDWYMDTKNMTEEQKAYLATGSTYGNSYLHEINVKKFRLATLQKMKNHLKNDLSGRLVNILKAFSGRYERIFLYGAGEYGREMGEKLEKENIKFDGFLVTEKSENEEEFVMGYPVYSMDEISINPNTDGIILAMTYRYQLEVLEDLYRKGFMNVCYI